MRLSIVGLGGHLKYPIEDAALGKKKQVGRFRLLPSVRPFPGPDVKAFHMLGKVVGFD